MKGVQLAFGSALEEMDRYALEREKRETDAIMARLDAKYARIDRRKLADAEYPDGSVVIVGQHLFRNNHYTWHFYRTVLTYYRSCADPHRAVFVEATCDEWPERPPWADTVGHEGEAKDIGWLSEFIYWFTGETVAPIRTWWMKRWFDGDYRRKIE